MLKQNASSKKAKEEVERVMNKTESNIEELKILYEHLEVECPRINSVPVNYCNSLKNSINAEVDSVKALFDLRKTETDDNLKIILDRVTDNRLEILKDLNNMFGHCKYRSY